jgi:hypothetical protein
MKLTKRTIDAIRPDPHHERFVWDDEVRGFGLRVKPSGLRSFIVQYRNSTSVSRRLTLGKFGILTADEARKLAKITLANVVKGADPAKERAEGRKSTTIRQLCQAYLDASQKGLVLGKGRRPKKPSTMYVDRGRIERHIIPLLGNRAVRDLNTPDIARFMRDVAQGKTADDIKTGFRGRAVIKGGSGTAARTVGLLGGILSHAVLISTRHRHVQLAPCCILNGTRCQIGSGNRHADGAQSRGCWRMTGLRSHRAIWLITGTQVLCRPLIF